MTGIPEPSWTHGSATIGALRAWQAPASPVEGSVMEGARHRIADEQPAARVQRPSGFVVRMASAEATP